MARFKANPVYLALWWLGTLLYGLYAWHGYVIQTWPAPSGGQWLIVAAYSLAAAYGSYRFIEAPALRQKRHPARAPSSDGLPVAV